MDLRTLDFWCWMRWGCCLAVWLGSATSLSAQVRSIPEPPAGAAQPLAAMGMMAGEVSDASALVQVRLTATEKLVDGDVPGAWGVVQFTAQPQNRSAVPMVQTAYAFPQRDFIARAAFTGLLANTQYRCSVRFGLTLDQLRDGPELQFKTLPGRSRATAVRFAVVTGMNYAKFHGDNRIDRRQHLEENNTELPAPYDGPDKQLGYPALESIQKLKPDFFIGTGDNVYYDTPDDPRAQTVAEMRQKWHEQFIQPRFRSLFASVPTYWIVDDHDYRVDDGDNTGSYFPLPETARRVLLEQLPYAPSHEPAAKTYRTHRVSQDLQVWIPENRFYRSSNAMPDGPQKSIWGDEQKRWLKDTLVASDATFKLLISPTPMVGPDDLRKTDNHCDVGGFQHERDEFFRFLRDNGLDQQNFFIVCGDRHWQYHALDSTGIEEFSCGALVDANSRLARLPGDPKGTDPQGLIRHLHTQTQRSGGFLMIQCLPETDREPAKLTFEFHDEKGKLLYRCQK
ncbi:alkaline phosphatase D family protein [Roseimaritima ulvae]|nr:alkaline phosphatase D family protein [Roseimaritima ulvae]